MRGEGSSVYLWESINPEWHVETASFKKDGTKDSMGSLRKKGRGVWKR